MSVTLPSFTDPVTHIYTREYFLQRLKELLPFARGPQGAYVLLEIDLWESVKRALSAGEQRELLLTLSNCVKAHFANSTRYGYMGESRFALFFEGVSGQEVESRLHEFLLDAKARVWLAGREDLRLTLSLGGTLFTLNGATLDTIECKSQEALHEAEEAGGQRVLLKQFISSDAQRAKTRRIILVDEDVDLCDVVRFLFENHGFEVLIFSTGQELIDYVASLPSLEENTLFILDRMLPDKDGLALLATLNERFPHKVRALFLTSLASEKDMLEGLKMGAIDYLVKPFSTAVLLQKAIAILS